MDTTGTQAAMAGPFAPNGMAGDWPLRPYLLAALLGIAGLAVHLASSGGEESAWRMALAAFSGFFPLALAFTLDRARWREPLVFSLAVGLVLAGLAFRAVRAGDSAADADFAFAAGLLAMGLAVPLFQAGFHRKRFATPYREAYYHVWTDAISAGGALAFTGLAWLVLLLLSALFGLLKIDILDTLMNEEWFAWTFSGLAFGAALGLLRNQLRILGTLQSVVLLVLSLLAVPLALGLVVFLLAMVVSGPEVLWQATRSATPVLLACAAGAFVLVNAVLRDADVDRPASRILRIATLILALSVLPLTLFAAISMGTRIDQHGLSPERLWGLSAIIVAIACGIAYVVAVLRGRRGTWAERVRAANLRLAVLICAVALLLSLPILDFGAIAARNQIARLQSGEVAPDAFDFDALRWDFGDGGRAALRRLARSDSETIAEAAQAALARDSRAAAEFRRADMFGSESEIAFDFADQALRGWITDHVRNNPWLCAPSCVALDLGPDGERHHAALVGPSGVTHVFFRADGVPYPPEPQVAPPAPGALDQTDVEVRPYAGRRIYVDGRPVGEPFE